MSESDKLVDRCIKLMNTGNPEVVSCVAYHLQRLVGTITEWEYGSNPFDEAMSQISLAIDDLEAHLDSQ